MNGNLSETATRPSPDKEARKRLIARSIWVTVPGTIAVIAVAYHLIPQLGGLEEPIARLMLATRWLVIAMIPYVAVCLAILGIRFSEGSHDPTRGDESDRLKIHCRVMQNTLEQFIWFAVCIFAIAPMLTSAEAHLIPIVCVFFLVARLLYWWGYLRIGTLGRAPGVQLTFTLNIHLFVIALGLLVRGL